MAEKKFSGAPFGTQTARFDVAGVHPKSKTPGTFTQTAYCKVTNSATSVLLGPGRYETEVGGFSDKSVMERASGPGWARAYELQRIAALPHLLHKEQWDMKRMLKRKLGPGSYEIKDFVQADAEKPKSTHGIIQTKENRFRERIKLEETPGPGTYGKGGVPHAAREAKEHWSPGTVGMLDSGKSLQRSLPSVGSHLGPGTYNLESFTDEMAKRVVSLRGPYDVFSADRNKPIKTGHYASSLDTNLGPGQYHLKSGLDDWNSEHRKKQGKFGKVPQYPENPADRIFVFSLSQKPRDPHDPAPCHYDPKKQEKPLTQAKKSPAFLSSSQRNDKMATKFFTGNFNSVGAGRYDVQKFDEAQDRNGHSSAFKSKSSKPNLHRTKFLQERLRGKDLQPEDKIFLVEPDRPQQYFRRTHTVYDRTAGPVENFSSRRAQTVI